MIRPHNLFFFRFVYSSAKTRRGYWVINDRAFFWLNFFLSVVYSQDTSLEGVNLNIYRCIAGVWPKFPLHFHINFFVSPIRFMTIATNFCFSEKSHGSSTTTNGMNNALRSVKCEGGEYKWFNRKFLSFFMVINCGIDDRIAIAMFRLYFLWFFGSVFFWQVYDCNKLFIMIVILFDFLPIPLHSFVQSLMSKNFVMCLCGTTSWNVKLHVSYL